MENHENQIQAIVKSLKTECYIWYGALAVLTVMSFMFAPKMQKLEADLTIPLQSALLLLMLGGLPAIFIWFRNRMTALIKVTDIPLRLKRYESYSRVRQGLFFVFGFLVLALNVFTVLKGAPMLFGVVIVLTMFILPSRGRLVMEASLLKPEEEVEKNNEELGSE